MHKVVALVLAVAVLAPASGQVVISQVYGGGGNTDAPYRNDYVELFNAGSVSVSLTGKSIQYASAAGTGNFGSNPVTALSGTLAPGQYYLVQQAAASSTTTNGALLPTADVIGTVNMSATAGKVALVNSTSGLACNGGSTACTDIQKALILDLVGFGTTANFYEGTGPTAAPSNTNAIFRKSNGCQDTNDNNPDFVAAAPAPRNTASAVNSCAAAGPPTISISGVSKPEGNSGQTAFAFKVTLSAPATSQVTFVANTQPSGTSPATSGTDYTALVDLAGSIAVGAQEAEVVVQVLGDTTGELDETFQVALSSLVNATAGTLTATGTIVTDDICDAPGATFISSIQGSGASSARVGQTVDVQAIVVGDFQGNSKLRGFYLQEEDADADGSAATSEGLFVFDNAFGLNVTVGDAVRVRGTVTEFSNLTELTNVTAMAVCSTGNTVTPAPVQLPLPSGSTWEQYEGMLVQFAQPLTVTGNFGLGRFGEVDLAPTRLFTSTHLASPGAPAIAQKALNDAARIVLDDDNNTQNVFPTLYPQGGLSAANTLRTGDVMSGAPGNFSPFIAIVDEAFGRYALRPAQDYFFLPANPRSAAPQITGRMKVASFNVLNYFTTLGSRGADTAEEFQRQRTKIIAAIEALNSDVVGLVEIQNDASASIADLVQGLNDAAGFNKYLFVNTGAIGTDDIRTAFIYQPMRVSSIGPAAILDLADQLNRPALAQDFAPKGSTWPGERVTVVVNHFKSKGSTCSHVSDPDTGDGQGNCNLTRLKMATAVTKWLAEENPTNNPAPLWDRNVLIIGDLNSYRMEDPVTYLKNAGYADLLQKFVGNHAYSYQFGGEAGYLDHGLANASLLRRVIGATEWHLNSDEPAVLDYNTEFKNAAAIAAFYAPDAFRSSDHDPLVIAINPLLGDFNNDGELDAKDRTALLGARGTQDFDPRMDMNSDGFLTQDDFFLWQDYFQSWKGGRYR